LRFLLDIAHLSLANIIVFGGVLTGVYYFSLYDDGSYLKKQITKEKTNIQQTEGEIKKQEEKLKHLETFKTELSVSEKSVSYFLNYIPNELSTIDIFALLNEEAKKAGINIEDKRDQPSSYHEFYEILHIKLKISGSFPQLALFCANLTQQKRILIVDTIYVNMSSDNKMIVADIDIFAFRYDKTKEQEAAKKGKG